MVEVINDIAIIFKRIKENEDAEIEEYIPFKVVEGYFYEEEGCFVDSEQNVYSHMASMAEIGNVFAGRINLYDQIKVSPNKTIYEIRKIILETANKYRYFKCTNEKSDEYNIIKLSNKETGEISIFIDKDTSLFYSIYEEINSKSKEKNSNDNVKTDNIPDETDNSRVFRTPLELINEIKKTIKGQDEAVETIVSTIWMRYKYPNIPKTNILMVGPTGVGKTAIFRKIKELLDIPLAIYGITGTSQSGYKGHDIEEMLGQLYYDGGGNIEKIENGIIMIDEFDKVGKKGELGDIATIAVQNELLKLVEGCEREIELGPLTKVTLNTTNITFVCCGAFSDLFKEPDDKVVGFCNRIPPKDNDNLVVTPEMIMNEGIISELMGRLPVIIKLNDISKKHDVLKDILLNSDESILNILVETLENEGIEVEGVENLIDSIVDSAIEKKSGARGLFGPTKNIFLKVFYDIDNNPGKYSKVVFGKNIGNDQYDYELVPKKVKTRTKKQELIVVGQ